MGVQRSLVCNGQLLTLPNFTLPLAADDCGYHLLQQSVASDLRKKIDLSTQSKVCSCSTKVQEDEEVNGSTWESIAYSRLIRT